jgi:hypothetical protein
VVQVSECEDIDLLNDLDGFNIRTRLSIPFSGPIDVGTVSSQTVFLVNLGSTLTRGRATGGVVGINQVVWDVETNTLHVAAGEQLDQHTRYALIVTRGIRDAAGNPIHRAEPFRGFLRDADFHSHRAEPFRELFRDAESDSHDADFHSRRDEALVRYAATLRRGFARVVAARLVAPQDIAAVSVFTTKSVTAIMEKLRGQVRAADAPAAAQFLLGNDGSRTVFALDDTRPRASTGKTERARQARCRRSRSTLGWPC